MSEVRVIDVRTSLEEAREHVDWYLQGDISVTGFDTETMSLEWQAVYRKLKHASEKDVPAIEKELEKHDKKALSPSTAEIATAQFTTNDLRCLAFTLQDFHKAEIVRKLIGTLKEAGTLWVLQNAKFDFNFIWQKWGIDFEEQKLHDTMISEILIRGSRDYRPVNLEEICKDYNLDEGLKKLHSSVVLSDWWDPNGLSEEQVTYMTTDVLVLPSLMREQKAIMAANHQLRVRQLENRLTPYLMKTENVGLRTDHQKLETFLLRGEEKLRQEQENFCKVFGDINPRSAPKMLLAIEKRYGVTPMKSEYDKALKRIVLKPSVDKYALLEYGLREKDEDGDYKYPEIESYLAIKELGKQLQMARKWYELPDNKLMINFYQLPIFKSDEDFKDGGARTGRLSSSPNAQNIEEFMKQFLVAPEGWGIGSSDYSQIELRLMASYAHENVLKDMFNTGRSPHKEMCKWAFQVEGEIDKKSKQYRIAKEVNFGFIYGMGGATFRRRVIRATMGEIRISEEEGWAFRQKFFERYPAVMQWHALQFANACMDGYVTTRSGRRRYYNEKDRPELDNQYKSFIHPDWNTWIKYTTNPTAAWRAADWKWKNISYNTPIQGTGADIAKLAMILAVQRGDPKRVRVFDLVHDSLDYFFRLDSADYAVNLINECMLEAAYHFVKDVQIEAEHTVGRCWAAKPKDLEKDARGLWVMPDNADIDSEFQEEYTIAI